MPAPKKNTEKDVEEQEQPKKEVQIVTTEELMLWKLDQIMLEIQELKKLAE